MVSLTQLIGERMLSDRQGMKQMRYSFEESQMCTVKAERGAL